MPRGVIYLFAALLAAVSLGQPGADEALAGQETGSLEAVAVLAPSRSSSTESSQNTANAQSLLHEGIAAFDAGRSGDAQMIFEQLVGRFPESAEAQSARRYLSQLYAGLGDSSAKVLRVTKGQHDDVETQAVAEAPAAAVPGNGAAEDDLVPSERLSELLRLSVGDRVFFSLGSSDLGTLARKVLRGQAGWLKQQDPSVKALIAGHADDPLDEDGNKILSARRAEAVRARLIEEGVAPDRVRVVALGRSEPVADCPSAQCAAQNRRAVTMVLERRIDQAPHGGSQSYYAPRDRAAPESW